jgi:hypothetical protein
MNTEETTRAYYKRCVAEVNRQRLVGEVITLVKLGEDGFTPLEEPGDTVIFRGMLQDDRGYVVAIVTDDASPGTCRAVSTAEVDELYPAFWTEDDS